eukprot:SAG31_NODE_4719_length_3010_cov_1.948128_2_plen_90_part_00
MLTYEGQEMQGTEAIINFFANPESGSPISRFCTKTAVTTFDVQPTGPDMSSLLVYVTGNIQVRTPCAHCRRHQYIYTPGGPCGQPPERR